jgi:hypothetical protein
MDDPETLGGSTSPAAMFTLSMLSTMYRKTRTERSVFLFQADEPDAAQPAKSVWIQGLPAAGRAPSRRRWSGECNPAPAMAPGPRRTVRPRRKAAFPQSVFMSIRAIDGVTISTGLSQDDWINGRDSGADYRRSQYRYRHNNDANYALGVRVHPDAGRPETRLAHFVDVTAGKQCAE